VSFVLAPKLRSSFAPEMFGSLPALVEPVSHQVQKPVNRHSGSLGFGCVKIAESLSPGSASGPFSSVRLVLEALAHTYRISTGMGGSLVSNPTFPRNNGKKNLPLSILQLLTSIEFYELVLVPVNKFPQCQSNASLRWVP
jgi:hypothetical protein